jgi:hypothetical protein
LSLSIVDDERVPRFVGERVGRIIVPPYTAMGLDKDGEIIGGAVFNGFTRADIEVTIAGRFTRGFIVQVGRYVFGQLGCLRISITTEQTEVVRIAERLGGQIEGMKRNCFGPGRDGFLLGILKDEWRYR